VQPVLDPPGFDLQVPPAPLSAHDRQLISEAIAAYKRTGQLPAKPQKSPPAPQPTAA